MFDDKVKKLNEENDKFKHVSKKQYLIKMAEHHDPVEELITINKFNNQPQQKLFHHEEFKGKHLSDAERAKLNIVPLKDGQEETEEQKQMREERNQKLKEQIENNLKDLDDKMENAQNKVEESKDKRNNNIDQIKDEVEQTQQHIEEQKE